MNKPCQKCGIEKDIEMFSRDRTRKDGRQHTCKECRNNLLREYQKTEAGKITIAKATKKYHKTEKGMAAKKRAEKKHRKKCPEKKRAQDMVYRAIRAGRLEKPVYCCVDSSECEGQIEGHHWDYSRPFDVTWLCRKHHRWAHHNEVSK